MSRCLSSRLWEAMARDVIFVRCRSSSNSMLLSRSGKGTPAEEAYHEPWMHNYTVWGRERATLFSAKYGFRGTYRLLRAVQRKRAISTTARLRRGGPEMVHRR